MFNFCISIKKDLATVTVYVLATTQHKQKKIGYSYWYQVIPAVIHVMHAA